MVRVAVLSCAFAGCGGYAYRDAAFEGAFAATMVVDALQTSSITAECRESNLILGECGERVPLAVYFPLVALAHVGISAAIAKGTWRTAWQSFSLGVALKVTHTNYMAGFRLGW
jgi:hypothetical protein